MKRFLPLVAAAVVMLLPAGAMAFDVSLVSVDPVFYSSAQVNSDPTIFAAITNPGLQAGEAFRIQGQAADSYHPTTNPSLISTASNNGFVIATQPEVYYGPGGVGKDTRFSLIIDMAQLQLSLKAGVGGTSTFSANPLLAFRVTREGSATPQIKLSLDWLGNSSVLNSLNTTYSLYAWAFGGAPTYLLDHKSAYGYNTSSTDTSADASTFLANINKPFFLSASLQDTLNGNGGTDGYSASASAYLKLTLDLIDPGVTGTIDDGNGDNGNNTAVPVPPGLLLLGSGLAAIGVGKTGARLRKGTRR